MSVVNQALDTIKRNEQISKLSSVLAKMNEDYKNAPSDERRRVLAIERSEIIAALNSLLKKDFSNGRA